MLSILFSRFLQQKVKQIIKKITNNYVLVRKGK